MALYVNINAGVGKPLWEITLGEFSVWFKVRSITPSTAVPAIDAIRGSLALPSSILPCRLAFVCRS